MKNIIILSAFLSIFFACSSDFYLKKAIKLNPNLLDSLKVTTIVITHDTIRDTIKVEGHNFSLLLDSIKQANDSTTLVYNDSILSIYAYVDILTKKIKIGGTVKPKLIPFEVIVHDTIKVDTKCPPQFVAQEKTKLEQYFIYTGWLFNLLLLIGLILLLVKLLK